MRKGPLVGIVPVSKPRYPWRMSLGPAFVLSLFGGLPRFLRGVSVGLLSASAATGADGWGLVKGVLGASAMRSFYLKRVVGQPFGIVFYFRDIRSAFPLALGCVAASSSGLLWRRRGVAYAFDGAVMGGGFYGALVRGAPGLEVGFIGDLISLGAGAMDVIAGGPQKRERTAKAMRDAEIAKAEAAAAAERTAALQLQAVQAQQAQQTQQATGGGLLTRKAGPLPVWGWAVAAVGVGGLAYWLLKDDGRGRGR